MPVVLAPVGLAGLNARRGEVQAAKAAAKAEIPFSLSTVSACSIEEVAAGSSKSFWFQLYVMRDRGFMRELLARAAAAGCSTLLFTVDLPLPGTRYRDYRSGLAGSPGWRGSLRRACQAAMKPRWAWDVGVKGRPHTLGNLASMMGRDSGLEDFLGWMLANFDASVTWSDLEFLRSEWKGPLIVKGILDVDDAIAANDIGADGIVVSNHGGRQLDGVPSTARALPEIAERVGEALTVLVDGGVRSGLDVVRMLALGARGVLLGRAWAYALAAGGEAGVSQLLQLIDAEMRVAMSLTGATSIAAIDSSALVRN
jgi:L-lactate dehydrogenase (cytochrome)